MTAPDPRPGGCLHGPDADTLARDLTYAVVRHYGYTDDDIAAAEAVHPGTVCGDDCHTEDGGTLHSAAWVELSQTAPVMVDVVAPHVKRILADAVAAAGQERDRLKRGGAELGKSLHFWMELARKVTDSDDLIGDDGDGDWGGVAERLAEMGEAHKRQIARAEAAERRLAEVEGKVRALRRALSELVSLKDGPRDSLYYERKPAAWEAARDALSSPEADAPVPHRDVGVREAVLAIVDEYAAKGSVMSPDDYRTGQDHLSPAFREVNYRDAFMALTALWNGFEGAVRAAVESAPATREAGDRARADERGGEDRG